MVIIEKSDKVSEPERLQTPPRPFQLRTHLRLMDCATLIYLGLVGGLLLFFHRGVANWPLLVSTHIAVALLIMYLIRAAADNSSKVLTFFRDSYPFFLFTFMFKEVSIIVNILFPFWLEPALIDWDLFLFGNHPTVWLQKFSTPWFSELMAFSYWSYYVFIPFVGIVLYVRKDRGLFHSYAFCLSLTMYVGYFLFLFLAARGPHETLAHLHTERELAWIFDRTVRSIQSAAKISGAAFPSSHVAAMWISWFFVFKFRKTLGWAFAPLVISLTFSVVYMQYHYAVDAIAGVVMALATYPVAKKIERKFKAPARAAASR